MSGGQMSVGQMSVGQMSVDQILVGQVVFDQMTRQMPCILTYSSTLALVQGSVSLACKNQGALS